MPIHPSMNHDSTEQQIDDAAVKRYFDGTRGGIAGTVSMMVHEHNLPACAARYRLHKEIRNISDWLDMVWDRRESTELSLALDWNAGLPCELQSRQI